MMIILSDDQMMTINLDNDDDQMMTINLDQWMWTSWQSLEKQSRHLAALTFLPITQIIIMIIIIWVIIIADYHMDDDSC